MDTRTEILTSVTAIAKVAAEWDRMARQDAAEGFFRRPAWYLSWIENVRPDAAPAVVVVRDSGAIVGIAPFCRLRHNPFLLALSLGGEDVVCGDYLDILAVPAARAAVVHAVWSAVYDLRSQWDLLVLGATPTQGHLCREAQDWAASRQLMFRAEAEQISPVISLPTSFDDYFASLSRKRRKNLTRAKRICAERGVTIRIYREPRDIGPAIDTLIDLHLLRWESVNRSGTLGKPGFRDFLKCLSQDEAMASCFRVYVMEDHGAPIAAMLNFHYGSSALQFQNGFDPGCELAPHSPGSLLILHAIEQAIREGLTSYDFLRGAEDYKFQFANAMKTTTTLLLARSLKAKAYQLLKDAELAIKRIRGTVFQPATTPAQEGGLLASPPNPFGATPTPINTGENHAGGRG